MSVMNPCKSDVSNTQQTILISVEYIMKNIISVGP